MPLSRRPGEQGRVNLQALLLVPREGCALPKRRVQEVPTDLAEGSLARCAGMDDLGSSSALLQGQQRVVQGHQGERGARGRRARTRTYS